MFHIEFPNIESSVLQRSTAFIVAFVVLVPSANVLAELVTVPTSLNPGDTYHLAFVTSGTGNAMSSNIADYNTFVTNAANDVPELSALGTSWFAIVSTSSISAATNTGTVPTTAGGSLGSPIFLLNDTQLADSNDDLWDGSIDVLFNLTELGTFLSGTENVWTGTGTSGMASSAPVGGASVSTGQTTSTDLSWIDNGGGDENPGELRSFYAISGPLSVAIPEPSAFCSFLVAVLCVSRYRVRQSL